MRANWTKSGERGTAKAVQASGTIMKGGDHRMQTKNKANDREEKQPEVNVEVLKGILLEFPAILIF